MNKPKIQWRFSKRWGYSGMDEEGNVYNQGHLRETTSVILVDGREGGDWTPEKALENAKSSKEATANYKIAKYSLWEHPEATSCPYCGFPNIGAQCHNYACPSKATAIH